jgi:hypothetical protein
MNWFASVISMPGRAWRHPVSHSIVAFGFSALSGIFGSAWVNELTKDNVVQWSKWNTVPTTVYLVALVLAFVVYQSVHVRTQLKARDYLDKEYCKAIMLSEGIPALAEKFRESIKKGDYKDTRDLHALYQELNK